MHDFRRSGVTALAKLDIPSRVAGKLLNDARGTIRGAAIFQRGHLMEECKRVLGAWAAHVLACEECAEISSNVIPMPSRAG
jgi:hypothetical protein